MDAMSWSRVAKAAQASSAHALLFTFTLLLVLKLDHVVSCSWWIVFFPVWLFHAVVARGRFSIPAPLVPHDRHWAPSHAVVAAPLLIAFELLLCVHLESSDAVNLKIVFVPLLLLEAIILIDNFRMCRTMMSAEEDNMSDEVIWDTVPHFWISLSMVFLLAATLFLVLKLSGVIPELGWWDLFINFSVGQCFAFLVCTKWSNPMIHSHAQTMESISSTSTVGYLDCTSGLIVQSDEDQNHRMCCFEDIGGHVMKVLIIVFQIILFMYLEGTPAKAREIPIPVIFSPLFLLQGAGVMFSMSKLVERIVLQLHSESGNSRYYMFSSRLRDSFEFILRGSRLLGWWSIDEGSREAHARLLHDDESGYDTFCSYPPDMVKKMAKKDLAEEVWRLQSILGEQTNITKFSQQEYERLQHEKVLCRVCYEMEISIVLLPCRHRSLCSSCSEKCKTCPICRVTIDEKMPVYDV